MERRAQTPPCAYISGQTHTRTRATRHAPPASRELPQGAGPRRPRQLSQRRECGAHDARPTGKAVPASAPCAHASGQTHTCFCATRHTSGRTITCFCATRHAPPRLQPRRYSLTGLGAKPQTGVQGCRRTPAAGNGGAQPPKALAGNGAAQAPTAVWSERAGHAQPEREKARTMRALRERPCQRQRQAHMPRGAE